MKKIILVIVGILLLTTLAYVADFTISITVPDAYVIPMQSMLIDFGYKTAQNTCVVAFKLWLKDEMVSAIAQDSLVQADKANTVQQDKWRKALSTSTVIQ